MFLALAFSVDEDVIKIHYYKNIELLYQNFIDIALENDQCIGQSKRYHLVLEMIVVGLEDCVQFIAFSDSHPMIGIG